MMSEAEFKELNICVEFNSDFVKYISMQVLEYMSVEFPKDNYYLDELTLYFDSNVSRIGFIDLFANFLSRNAKLNVIK